MTRESKARDRKRVTKDLAPRRQAKGGKGEVIGIEPYQAQAQKRCTSGGHFLMDIGSGR